MDGYKKYERSFRAETEDSLSRISSLIDPHSVVLDIGCSSGMLGRFLVQEKGCVIDGVDIDSCAIEDCKGIYRRVAVRNLETDQLTDCFKEESYDYIVIADVIEHLVEATALLEQLKLLIKPSGMIVFSIPNITHVAPALRLLLGDFSYRPSGLLDSTHLRFFSRESFLAMIERNGIYCWNIHNVERGINDTEFGDDIEIAIPQPWLQQVIEGRSDALVYQWIFEAKIFPQIDKSKAPSRVNRPPLIPLLNACLYWDDGKGFAEERKLMGLATKSSSGNRQLEFNLDDALTNALVRIRIDPFSSPQWINVRSARLLDDTGRTTWCWKPGENDGVLNNACWIGESGGQHIVLADHCDAHWIPDIPSQVLAEVRAGWKFSMEVIGQSQMQSAELVRLIERMREELLRSRLELRKVADLLVASNAQLEVSNAQLEVSNGLLEVAGCKLDALLGSNSWRITRPLRWVSRRFGRLLGTVRFFFKRALKGGGILRREGISGVVNRLSLPTNESLSLSYSDWIVREEQQTRYGTAVGSETRWNPLISIVMPTFNTPLDMLERAIMSVRRQDYAFWELCIADDASTSPEVKKIIQQHSASDTRIRAVFRESNGHIAEATNSALAMATGDYVGFLDHDDQLANNALSCLAQEIDAHPSVDILYTDEDKITEAGVRSAPFFKPDWSPHLAISQAYLGHFVCYRNSLVKEIGGLRTGFDGAQDYDFWLRATRSASEIRHIPKVLYHWRMHQGSTAANGEAKPYAHEAGRKAVSEYLRTRYSSTAIEAVDGEFLFTYRAKFSLPNDLVVSIIIPTKDKLELLEPCIRGILENSTWKNFEIIIVDNNSAEPLTFDFFTRIQNEDDRVQVIALPIPFNWSRLNNLAANRAKGDVIVFLNNDTEIISPDWLENLAGFSLLPDVGVVGGLLLFEDGTIQHSGVVVGMHEWADHVFKGQKPIHSVGPFVSPVLTRNVLAVTGACMAVSRERFVELSGFDEEFEICGSDVELGIRAHKRGYFNVLCAEAKLFHHESKTRSPYVPENDFIQSDRKYHPYRLHARDPFFNRNLSLRSTSPDLN